MEDRLSKLQEVFDNKIIEIRNDEIDIFIKMITEIIKNEKKSKNSFFS